MGGTGGGKRQKNKKPGMKILKDMEKKNMATIREK